MWNLETVGQASQFQSFISNFGLSRVRFWMRLCRSKTVQHHPDPDKAAMLPRRNKKNKPQIKATFGCAICQIKKIKNPCHL